MENLLDRTSLKNKAKKQKKNDKKNISLKNASLGDVAKKIQNTEQKVQLIYAFNGTGKTRLSLEFYNLFQSQKENKEERTSYNIIYYNSYTEDLFYWHNDLENEYQDPKLIIQKNNFITKIMSVLKDYDAENNIAHLFKHYTSSNLEIQFNQDYTEVYFYNRNNKNKKIKISKGEESNFIWCVFYAFLELILVKDNVKINAKNAFNNLEYIYIDDPVSSLDENHLIELATDLAELINEYNFKFIISTHNFTFYNILHNHLKNKYIYFLEKNEDGTYFLNTEQIKDSSPILSYNMYLFRTLCDAIKFQKIEKIHFLMLRNLYEKTAVFLGYKNWGDLLPYVENKVDPTTKNKKAYYNRIIQFSSHSTGSTDSINNLTPEDKKVVERLLKHLLEKFNYQKFWEPTDAHK